MLTLDRLYNRLLFVQFELYEVGVEGAYREELLKEEEGLAEEISWLEYAMKWLGEQSDSANALFAELN